MTVFYSSDFELLQKSLSSKKERSNAFSIKTQSSSSKNEMQDVICMDVFEGCHLYGKNEVQCSHGVIPQNAEQGVIWASLLL